MILRCPAPTTMILRPVSRPRPGASPSVSGCSDADGSSCRGACVVLDMACSLFACFGLFLFFIMAGHKREAHLRKYDPAIHVFGQQGKQVVDARVKPGHDDLSDAEKI